MRIKRIALAAALAAGLAAPAHALTINFSTIQGDSLSQTQSEAFTLAAKAWSNIIRNDVTLSVRIGFAALGDRVLGQTSNYISSASASVVEAALARTATTPLGKPVVLPAHTTDAITYTTAQGKALGLTDPHASAVDGTIEFSTRFAFSDKRDDNGRIAAGTYDLIGIAEHEIGHLLGFVSNVDWHGSSETVLDLFRYDAFGQSSMSTGVPAFFSLDGGKTALAEFADGKSDQASHWADGTLWGGVPAVMDPEVGESSVRNITALDRAAMGAIGWDTGTAQVSAVPLPAAAPLFGIGLALLGAGWRRRGQKVAA